ncbi:MAG TPA: UDP-N-acetylmuramoyl-L-alanyl-D-glutamate--2,6-diaminopimelate ligase [Candidatus Saccharimonadales bacterium]|nr:UDP-N-acetylmuramoyl-L-alanyl-D-glutamate--2,6-diaminopimelate ligase [Candidatus Saccharimonadales bacterium]
MNPRTIVKKFVPKKVFRTVEPYGHLGEAVALNTLKGFPSQSLKVIGVTGTNGKTTTCFLIHRMLHEAGYKVGLMTTVAYGVGDDIKPQIEHMTTAGVPVLLKRFKYMQEQGVDWLILETTSHALAQYRVWGVPYSVAVMTNITEEHLDYHGTFEKYRDAKRKLFKLTNKNRKGLRTGIINAEDPSAELFAQDIKNPVTYGIKRGDLKAKNVEMNASGSRYSVEIGSDKYNITCHLPGSFNVYNSLAALGVGRTLGLSVEQIEQGIAALKSVEGRMVTVDEGQDFEVIVDYAHTPDSFEKLFKDIKPLVKGKLIVMFGSAGRRDEKKRAVQGELAGKYADIVFVTEEDDRDMDGLAIMEEIAAGAEKIGKIRERDLFLIHKREEAIAAAFKVAKKGDVVLLLGKGHEKSILSNGPKAAELRHLQQDDANQERVIERPYDEVKAARTALRNR